MNYNVIMELLEAFTILCFGLSWPISIIKSYRARTAKGKSLFFEVFLLVGYAFGIARKLIQLSVGEVDFLFYFSLFFYVLNFVEISVDVLLYFRNVKLDKEREMELAEVPFNKMQKSGA